MKHIIAFVKPNMLDDVIFALHEIEGFPGASLSEVQGIGRGLGRRANDKDRTPYHELPRSMRIEIACPGALVNEIMETIQAKAHTGLPGDGNIYLCDLEDAIRIRTGERGEAAM